MVESFLIIPTTHQGHKNHRDWACKGSNEVSTICDSLALGLTIPGFTIIKGENALNDEVIASKWLRTYADSHFKNNLNEIRLSKANTPEHNLRVCQICVTLLHNNIPFYTEVRLKNGARPDIVCPTHSFKIIEVLHTETNLDFVNKKLSKYDKELHGDILLHHTSMNYEEKQVL